MIAMRNSVNQIYKNNPKAGMCEPMIEMPEATEISQGAPSNTEGHHIRASGGY